MAYQGMPRGGVGAAVEGVDHDHHLAVEVVAPRLLGQDAHLGPPEHRQRGRVRGHVAEVLARVRPGRARRPPVPQAAEGAPHRHGRLMEQFRQGLVRERHGRRFYQPPRSASVRPTVRGAGPGRWRTWCPASEKWSSTWQP